ncbi:MAG: hypothetical protein QOI20_984 [Acidimicrobiaceae bacterium]|jgi:uncharacterized protein (TIGR03083 family)|nr:hypothetical protein [Acidimicrobiaceae bacterium]
MDLEARVRANVDRVRALLAGADGARPIPGSDWTVAEAGAHVVSGARNYVELFRGVPSPVGDISETAAVNASHLAEYAERDPAAIAADLPGTYDEVLAAYREAGPDAVLQWHGGLAVTAADNLGVLLGELVVHGWDIAQGLGRPWPIDPADARAVLVAGLRVAPVMVDRDKARRLTGTMEIRLRGGERVSLRWRDGALDVGEVAAVGQALSDKADCVISAEPVAFLLQSYGRGSKWRPLLTGKVMAWGRKPMLALRMQTALRQP